MRKRAMAIGILFMLTLFQFALVQADEGDKQSGLFSYRLKGNGTAIITGFDWETNGANDIYVPKLIDGYEVTEIGVSAFSMEKAENPREEMDSTSMFWLINGMSTDLIEKGVVVVLPDSITTIGEKAFFLSVISSINISHNCHSIGSGAFAGCQKLSAFSVETGNPLYTTIDGVLYNKKNKELISYPAGKEIPKSGFSIPEGIKAIGDYAFYGMDPQDLTIDIPSTVKSIGKCAFALDYKLKTSLANIEDIDDYSFYKASIDGIQLDNVRSIGSHAFEECFISGLMWGDRKLVFPSSLESIGEYAFSSSYWEISSEYIIDLSQTQLKVLNTSLFHYIKGRDLLLKFVLPSSLEQINENAFSEMFSGENFTSSFQIIIPNSVKAIGDKAFYKSKFQEKAFEIPEGVISIGDEAFVTETLERLIIPESVTTIGSKICDRSKTRLDVKPGSYAAIYASENGYNTITSESEDTSWLND